MIGLETLSNPIPLISPVSNDANLTYQNYFFRLVPPFPYESSAVLSLMMFMNWKEVAVISSSDWYGTGFSTQFLTGRHFSSICFSLN